MTEQDLYELIDMITNRFYGTAIDRKMLKNAIADFKKVRKHDSP